MSEPEFLGTPIVMEGAYDDAPEASPNLIRGCPYCKSDETFLVAWHGRIRCTSCEARYDADAKLLIERPSPVDDTPYWRKPGYSGPIPMRRRYNVDGRARGRRVGLFS